jgi:hypothetical protein
MNETQISVRSRQVRAQGIHLAGMDIVITGGWPRRAAVKDEEYVQGNPGPHPERGVPS